MLTREAAGANISLFDLTPQDLDSKALYPLGHKCTIVNALHVHPYKEFMQLYMYQPMAVTVYVAGGEFNILLISRELATMSLSPSVVDNGFIHFRS